MKQYTVDIDGDAFVIVPDKIRYQIIQDHLTKSYHWVIGTGMFLIGFLVGVLARG